MSQARPAPAHTGAPCWPAPGVAARSPLTLLTLERLVLLSLDEVSLPPLVAAPAAWLAGQGLTLAPNCFESLDQALGYALTQLRAQRTPPPWTSYLFIHQASGTVIGIGGFKGPPVAGTVELGYAIAPAWRGQGYATEAALGLARRAAVPGVAVILAHTLAETNASCRVLEKVGFCRTRELHDPSDGWLWRWELPAASLRL